MLVCCLQGVALRFSSELPNPAAFSRYSLTPLR
jgi:hypothetical protein